jgi:hypothetical protein
MSIHRASSASTTCRCPRMDDNANVSLASLRRCEPVQRPGDGLGNPAAKTPRMHRYIRLNPIMTGFIDVT